MEAIRSPSRLSRASGICETPDDSEAYFMQRVQEILKKYGKTMVGWDEVLHPDLAPDTVIQSWRGPAALADAANEGYRGILSFGYYLDHMNPASFHYAIDPQLDDESAKLHSGRRSVHVDGIREPGDDRFANLAARRSDRRAAVVAQGRYQRRVDV